MTLPGFSTSTVARHRKEAAALVARFDRDGNGRLDGLERAPRDNGVETTSHQVNDGRAAVTIRDTYAWTVAIEIPGAKDPDAAAIVAAYHRLRDRNGDGRISRWEAFRTWLSERLGRTMTNRFVQETSVLVASEGGGRLARSRHASAGTGVDDKEGAIHRQADIARGFAAMDRNRDGTLDRQDATKASELERKAIEGLNRHAETDGRAGTTVTEAIGFLED